MPFSAGDLCCVSAACVLLDTNVGDETETWEKIPHVTNISVQQTANTQKLVTSSTFGRETSACGTVTQTGTLEVACHSGVGPGFLCVNNLYRIRWSINCNYIWNSDTCAPLADNATGQYLEAMIRITSLPINLNISGNQPIIYTYNFDIVMWKRGHSPCDYGQAPQTGWDSDYYDC